MVRAVVWLAIAAAAAAPRVQDPARFADVPAQQLLQGAQAALINGRAEKNVRSLVLKGRLRTAASRTDMVEGQVEIRVLFPDRYLRVDAVAGKDLRSGLSGRTLLTPHGDLAAERAAFARLTLGLVAYAPPDSRLTFKSTGDTAFADTTAVDVDGASFSARLVFDASSRIPLRLVYDSRYGAGTVMSFANRRDVDGVQLASRVTTLIADRVLETLMFDEMQVNADLRDAEFRK